MNSDYNNQVYEYPMVHQPKHICFDTLLTSKLLVMVMSGSRTISYAIKGSLAYF